MSKKRRHNPLRRHRKRPGLSYDYSSTLERSYASVNPGPSLADEISRLLLPIAKPIMREFSMMVFYDQRQDYERFVAGFQKHIKDYSSTTQRELDAVQVALRSMPLPQLEQIVAEERCDDPEVFVGCCFLEIYKICPENLVVAIGPTSQQIITELKKRSHDRPDGGERFLTLAEVLAKEPLLLRPDSEEAEDRYFQAMVERLYAF